MDTAVDIEAILSRAGGAPGIAKASLGSVKRDAVYKWRKIGIPDRHWPLVMKLSGASADDMLNANIAVRSKKGGQQS